MEYHVLVSQIHALYQSSATAINYEQPSGERSLHQFYNEVYIAIFEIQQCLFWDKQKGYALHKSSLKACSINKAIVASNACSILAVWPSYETGKYSPKLLTKHLPKCLAIRKDSRHDTHFIDTKDKRSEQNGKGKLDQPWLLAAMTMPPSIAIETDLIEVPTSGTSSQAQAPAVRSHTLKLPHASPTTWKLRLAIRHNLSFWAY